MNRERQTETETEIQSQRQRLMFIKLIFACDYNVHVDINEIFIYKEYSPGSDSPRSG